MPYPLPLTRTEAYLAYKAGVITAESLKPSLSVPRIGIDAWLAYWTGLALDYPEKGVGKNLFNKNNRAVVLNNLAINSTTGRCATNEGFAVVCARCKPNTTYTISKEATTRFTIAYYDSIPKNGDDVSGTLYVNPTNTTMTYTTGENANYILVMVRSSADTDTVEQIASTVQIEEGNEATAYEPYTGEPIILQEEEAYIAYLCGVINEYPEKCLRRVGAYLRYLISARWGRPDHPLNREELYLSLIKTQVIPSGDPSSDIEIDGTAKAAFQDLNIYGDTGQDTFQGLNLFDINAIYPVGRIVQLNGITVTFEQDGVVEMNGSFSGANVEITGGVDAYKIPIDQTKEYYLRIDLLDGEWYGTFGSSTPSFSYECRYNNGASVYYRGNTLNANGTLAKIDISGGVEYITRLRFYTNYGGGDRVVFRKLKMRVAIYETADPGFYEPFVGLAKSPSPLYPQVANSVTGEQTIRVTKKNILHELMSGEYTDADSGSTWRFDNGTIYMSRTEGSWQGGSINICNGDTQRWAGWSSGYDTPIANQPGKYTISVKRTGNVGAGSGTVNLGIYPYIFKGGHSRTQLSLINVATTDYGSMTITLEEGDILGSLVLYSQYAVLDNVRLEIQIEHGEEATEFESPVWNDYKINLGKNLFDKSTAPVLNAYLDQSAGVIVAAGNYRTAYIVCEPNTVYTVSKTGNSPLRVAYTNTANPQIGDAIIAYQRDLSQSSQSLTIYTGPEAHTLLIGYKEQGFPDTEGNLDSVQVERGTKATDYASYVTPIELHSHAGYQDRIYKKDGDWILHKEIGHLVRDVPVNALNGSQSGPSLLSENGAFQLGSWDWGSDYDDTISRAFLSEDIGTLTTQEVNNNAEANSMPDGTYCHRAGTNDRIYFRNTVLIGKTGVEVREIMKQENGGVNFWYPLQEPVETVITDQALINQLEAFMAGGAEDGITNIKVFPQSPDLPGLLYVEAPKYE